MRPVIGIVVVSYGSADLLRENLARVALPVTSVGTRVVVVDNFRSLRHSDAVRACAVEHGWDLLANDDNRGFGAAANQGLARAATLGCTTAVVVNPDLSVDGDVLSELVATAERHPRALVSPRVVRPDGRDWFTGGSVDLRRGWTRNVVAPPGPVHDGWVTGACLAATSSLWSELGGFDEDYVLYWEDVDLSHRCLAAGGALVVRQDLVVVHAVGGTQGEGKSPAYVRFNTRNRLLFAAKHLRRRDAARWVAGAGAYAWAVVRRGGRRGLLRRPDLVWHAVRGTTAGGLRVLAAAARGRP